MTFGEKLQKLRAQAGLSQDALAELLDVSRQAVSKWERDEAMPEAEKLLRISDQFHVTIDSLLREEEEAAPPPPPRRSPADWLRNRGWLLGVVLAVYGLWRLLQLLTGDWAFLGSLMEQGLLPVETLIVFLVAYGSRAAPALGMLAAGLVGTIAGFRRAGRLRWYHGGTLLAVGGAVDMLCLLAVWAGAAALRPELWSWGEAMAALGSSLLCGLILALAGLAILVLGRRYDAKSPSANP